MTTTARWTHQFVRRSRGMDGQWYDLGHPVKCQTEQEARTRAADFATELAGAGVVGTYISVRRRGGRCVAEYIPTDGRVDVRNWD